MLMIALNNTIKFLYQFWERNWIMEISTGIIYISQTAKVVGKGNTTLSFYPRTCLTVHGELLFCAFQCVDEVVIHTRKEVFI